MVAETFQIFFRNTHNLLNWFRYEEHCRRDKWQAIAIWSQSISGVIILSLLQHPWEKGRETLFFCSIPDSTRDFFFFSFPSSFEVGAACRLPPFSSITRHFITHTHLSHILPHTVNPSIFRSTSSSSSWDLNWTKLFYNWIWIKLTWKQCCFLSKQGCKLRAHSKCLLS
jgi:hypothetical protein